MPTRKKTVREKIDWEIRNHCVAVGHKGSRMIHPIGHSHSVPMPCDNCSVLIAKLKDKIAPYYNKPKKEQVVQFWLDIEAGKVSIMSGWVVVQVDQCTCAGGTPESNGMHEAHCGYEPLCQLIDFIFPDLDPEKLQAWRPTA